MKKEDLFRMLGEIDDELIEEAADEKKKSVRRNWNWSWQPAISAAAAVVLLIGLSGSYLFRMAGNMNRVSEDYSVENQQGYGQETVGTSIALDTDTGEETWDVYENTDPVEVISSQESMNEIPESEWEVFSADEFETGVYSKSVEGSSENTETYAEDSLENNADEYSGEEELVQADSDMEEEELDEIKVEDSYPEGTEETARILEDVLLTYEDELYYFTDEIEKKAPGKLLGTILIEELDPVIEYEIYGTLEDHSRIAIKIEEQYYLLEALMVSY